MTKERIRVVLNNMSLSKEDKESLFKLFTSLVDFDKQVYTKEEANNLFLTKNDASSSYLKKTDASNTYLNKTDASNTYLTKTTATSTYATKAELNNKQETLVSGTNIKTINGESLLGSGDIVIPTHS